MQIQDWSSLELVGSTEHLLFDAPAGPRHCRIAGVVNEQTEVWLSDAETGEARLVAVVRPGEFEFRFHINAPVHLKFAHSETGVVYVRPFAKSHLVQKTTGETFTTIANRAARNPQLEAILFQLRQNEARREEAFARELARIKAAQEAHANVQPAPASAPPAQSVEVGAGDDPSGLPPVGQSAPAEGSGGAQPGPAGGSSVGTAS